VARTKRARRPRGTRPEAQGTRASAGPARAPAEAEVRELEALTATHWFDSGDAGEPYTATVRFRGTRIGGGRRPAAHDDEAELNRGLVAMISRDRACGVSGIEERLPTPQQVLTRRRLA